jgi:uncharacterized ubiquitin-like protein YukD
MTNKIKVKISDVSGAKIFTVELPIDVATSRLLPALITKLEHSTDKQYELMHKESGKKLAEHQTLQDIGVKPGDVLRILPLITAATEFFI